MSWPSVLASLCCGRSLSWGGRGAFLSWGFASPPQAPNARGERRATPNQPTSATRCPLWPVRSSALFGGGRRPGVGDPAPLPGRPAAYRLPPTTGTSAAPLRPPALPALVGTMPRRPPAARATERYLDILQEWAIISWNDISPAFLCDLQSTGGQSVATNAIPSALQV